MAMAHGLYYTKTSESVGGYLWIWHADYKVTSGVGAWAHDRDLGTLYVELGAGLVAGAVQSDEHDAEEIATWGSA
jgi:hypothetical protein